MTRFAICISQTCFCPQGFECICTLVYSPVCICLPGCDWICISLYFPGLAGVWAAQGQNAASNGCTHQQPIQFSAIIHKYKAFEHYHLFKHVFVQKKVKIPGATPCLNAIVNTVHHKRTTERSIERDWWVAESTSGGSSGLGGN